MVVRHRRKCEKTPKTEKTTEVTIGHTLDKRVTSQIAPCNFAENESRFDAQVWSGCVNADKGAILTDRMYFPVDKVL